MGRRRRGAVTGVKPALRIVVALCFAGALVGAAVMTASGSRLVGHSSSHSYPPDRANFERPKVHGHSPLAAWRDTVRTGASAGSLASLARLLPRNTIRRLGAEQWLLTAPVDILGGARVALSGGTLELAPGAFLQARSGGKLALRGMTVLGVGTDGRPLEQPVASRAFLVGRDGGQLVLEHDQIRDLGHLGVYSYGIALHRPLAGSRVTGCTVDRNYFGIYMSHANGVLIADNRVSHSAVYGIDPYGYSHRVTIKSNVVSASGLHGIVLADGVSASRVVANTVNGAGGHGIVLYRGSHGNLISSNVVQGSFDGIVLTGAPQNTVEQNKVGPVVRFGLRLSGASNENLVTRNTVSHSMLGAYLYGGASRNRLLGNVFRTNRENVRVRSDAPHNLVWPRPPDSEGLH